MILIKQITNSILSSLIQISDIATFNGIFLLQYKLLLYVSCIKDTDSKIYLSLHILDNK